MNAGSPEPRNLAQFCLGHGINNYVIIAELERKRVPGVGTYHIPRSQSLTIIVTRQTFYSHRTHPSTPLPAMTLEQLQSNAQDNNNALAARGPGHARPPEVRFCTLSGNKSRLTSTMQDSTVAQGAGDPRLDERDADGRASGESNKISEEGGTAADEEGSLKPPGRMVSLRVPKPQHACALPVAVIAPWRMSGINVFISEGLGPPDGRHRQRPGAVSQGERGM